MKDFKFKTTFSSKLRCLVDEEKDKYLALASADELKNFLPKNIDFEKRYDLLAFAGDAFVANRINKNFDGVTTKEALVLADLFPFSFVDADHSRSKLLGVILNVGFAEFGTDKPLTREEVSKLNSPFTVVLGGIIWRIPDPELAAQLEETSNPESDSYQSCYLSWEVGFQDINLILLKGNNKNTEDGKIISDPKEIADMEKHLKANGGSGKIGSETIARVIVGDVLPIAVGIVTSPAATVTPMLIVENPTKVEETAEKAVKLEENTDNENNLNDKNDISAQIIENNSKIISHSENNNVKTNDKNMKISKIQDITDENLKQMSASNISEFVNEELTKAGNKFQDEKNAKEEVIKEKENLIASQNKITEELEKVKANLKTLEDEKQVKAKQELFDSRMANFDKDYDLTDEDRQVLASQIKDLAVETFASFEKGVKVLMKEKNKAFKAEQIEAAKKKAKQDADNDTEDKNEGDEGADNDTEDKKESKDAKKKKKQSKAADEEVVAAVLEDGEETKDIPNAGDVAVKSLKDKYADAFKFENCVSNKKR